MGKAAARKRRGRGAAAAPGAGLASSPPGAPWVAFEKAGRRALAAGDVDRAVEAFARAVVAGSTSPDVSNDLGVLLAQRGQMGAAVVHFETALVRAPHHRDAHRNLLLALEELAVAAVREGRLVDAAVCFARLAALDPRNGSFHSRAGAAWRAARRPHQALPYLRRARALRPDDADVCFGLGSVLLELDQKEGEVELERALTLRPDFPDALCNLALVRSRLGRVEDARRLLERALVLNPEHAEAHGNLGGLLREQGEIDASLAHHRRAAELRPESPVLASSVLLARQADPTVGPLDLVAEHRAWNDRFAAPLDPGPSEARAGRTFASRDRDPDRRLRVAYVSADLRSHSVASFIEPLVVAHDRAAVEVFCYSDGIPDAVTARIRAAADGWNDTRGLSDGELATQIEADRIDVLVDLHGHTSGNRLLCFARRPAPVQVTYCGYPGTTGLASMGWRLTDAIADPPGSADAAATERLWRLPSGFLCFLPDAAAGDVGALPAAADGQVTFGSFNNLAKVNEGVLAVWARILEALPASRLFLKSRALSDPRPATRLRAFFEARGIDPLRIAIAPYAANPTAHLALYRQVDIGLDPFPYNGTTTTCEALWMGIPVVTLTGATHAGRVGASLLTRVGLPELVTDSPDAYVSRALSLARDLPALARLRASLRARVASSPLVSVPTVARDIEFAYRAMWRLFCEQTLP